MIIRALIYNSCGIVGDIFVLQYYAAEMITPVCDSRRNYKILTKEETRKKYYACEM